jgi:enoyl-CoA hydratase
MAEIRYAVDRNVAVITLAAEERRNALTPEMARELTAVLDAADADDQIGAIVITGGPNFCAGAHRATLAAAAEDPAGDDGFRAIGDIYTAFLRVTHTKLPSVAAVRGAAVGAGVNLALAADLRVVSTTARIRSGFADIGLHPGGGHFALLGARGGPEVAAAAGLFGCELSGSDALRLGIAWRAVADDEVEEAALELAAGVARDPELSRAMTATFRQEAALSGPSWATAAQLERAPQMWSLRRRSAAGA